MKFTISLLSVLSALLTFTTAQSFYEDDGLYAREAEAGEYDDLYGRSPEEFDDDLFARDLDAREAEAFDDIYARAPEDVDNTIFDYEY